MSKSNDRLPIRVPSVSEPKYDAIEEVIQSLARKGLIFDTGVKRWSERTASYQTVWVAVPGAKLE